MENLISVIVPVYNSEAYIDSCIESVRNQTYSHLELILIDDGSLDSSRKICQTACEKDERIRLLKQEHRGVSAARNAGMDAAGGTYLFFLDSDDAIHPKLLEILHKRMEERSVTIGTEGRLSIEDETFLASDEWETGKDHGEEGYYLNSRQAIDYEYFGSSEASLYGIGGKMIRREAVKTLRFHEGLSNGEDTLFLYRLIAGGADAFVLKRKWYYYRLHEGGAASIFSVETCRCRHEVNRAIRNRELKSGRRENALRWERIILNALEKWYEIGKAVHDDGLREYVKQLARAERKTEAFAGLNMKRKINFCIMFECYPVHRMISFLYRIFPAIKRICSAGYRILFAVYQIFFLYQMVFDLGNFWKNSGLKKERQR